jgi:hypothetical protein
MRQLGSDRSVAAAAEAADVVAVDVETRHPAAKVVTAVVIAVVRGDLAAEAVVVEAVVIEGVVVEAVVVEAAMSFSRRGCGRHTAGDGERNRGGSDNFGSDRHFQSPSDLTAAVVVRIPDVRRFSIFGLKVAGDALHQCDLSHTRSLPALTSTILLGIAAQELLNEARSELKMLVPHDDATREYAYGRRKARQTPRSALSLRRFMMRPRRSAGR